jgi:predicted membrane-bound spermidine synthase
MTSLIRSQPPQCLPRWVTAVVALSTGWGVMAAELSLVRLVTPYLGASLPIWATIIALVLVSLAVGATLGGRLSRRSDPNRLLVLLLAAAGLLLALAPVVHRGLLGALIRARGAALVPPGAGLLLLGGLPLLLAGAVTPLLVQARTRGAATDSSSGSSSSPGAAAGLVTAASTAGSLLGTLVPAFLTLPWLGTSRTFLLAATPLAACALLVHRVTRQPGATGPGAVALALLVAGGALAPVPLVPRRAGTVATAESAHHHIAIVRRPEGHLVLSLDAGYAQQSYYDPADRLYYGPWPVLAASPLLARPHGRPGAVHRPWEVLLVGLGGGTTARMLVRAFPRARVTGAELDGEILRLARRHLGLRHPRIRARVADGRRVLGRAPDASVDVVLLDAAHQLLVPFHLVTTELFYLARRKLRPGGVVLLNLARLANDTALLDAVAHTGRQTFSHAYRLDMEGSGNVLLVLADHALDPAAVARRAAALWPPGLARFAALHLARLTPWRPATASPALLTDDRAPVAPLILAMLWRHAFGSP